MESNTFSRRQAVQTIAAAVSTVTAPVSALANVENRDGLFELWKERERLIEECRVLDRQWLEARDRLPSWCRMGAKYLSQNGLEVGPEVGWPRTDDGAILLADGRWLIRPSPSDLRRLSEEDISVVSREQALCLYRHRVSELRNRLRQRRELFSRNGVPRSVDWHRLESRIVGSRIGWHPQSNDRANGLDESGRSCPECQRLLGYENRGNAEVNLSQTRLNLRSTE
jgi:hypothetical protein